MAVRSEEGDSGVKAQSSSSDHPHSQHLTCSIGRLLDVKLSVVGYKGSSNWGFRFSGDGFKKSPRPRRTDAGVIIEGVLLSRFYCTGPEYQSTRVLRDVRIYFLF